MEVGEGGLVARLEHSPDGVVELAPVHPDTFMTGRMRFRFQRDAAGSVVGLDYGNPVVRSLRFTRLRDGT